MPKLKENAIPSYRLHKQSGQAVVTLNERDVLLGTHGTAASRAEYNRTIGEWMANGRQLPRREDDREIRDIVDAYWTHVQRYYRDSDGNPTTEQENIRQAVRPLKRLYGQTSAAEFGPLALKAVRAEMMKRREVTDPKTGKATIYPGWCRTNVNRAIARLKGMFKWAAGCELIPPSVYHGVQAVEGLRRGRSEARESDPVRSVPEANVNAVLLFVSRQIAAMIQLQLLTGARAGEIFVMRTCDIDQGGKVWTYRPGHHKTEHHGHTREIRLGPKAQAVVRPFLRPDLAGYLFSPADAEAERRAEAHKARVKNGTPLSCGNVPGSNVKKNPKHTPGDRFVMAAYRRAIARACVKANVPSWHPHQLRHTAATKLRKEFGLEAAQVILGHKTLTVTQIYAEKNLEEAARVMAVVG